MTQGERLVWAAAYAQYYNEMSNGVAGQRGDVSLPARVMRERKRNVAICAAAKAEEAVEAMQFARAHLAKKKKQNTRVYKDLLEMLKEER